VDHVDCGPAIIFPPIGPAVSLVVGLEVVKKSKPVAEGQVRVRQHGPPKELESDLINVQFSIPNSHLRNIHTNAFCSDENWELRIEH
jgi:hypothetical protein